MSINREIFFRHLGLPSDYPIGIEIVQADGVYLFDREGKDYIDLISGVSVSNIGHRHPEVISAIKNQADKYLHLMVYGEIIQEPQTQLAKLLTSLLPGSLDAVYFVNSGSEAIEGAIKLAKRYTGHTEIIAFKNAYHGGTHGALSILGDESFKNAFRPLLPDVRIIEFNNFDDLKQISSRTACVVAEMIQAEAGVIEPKPDFIRQLRERCSKTKSLLIVDDIQMGFGRTGKLFSFEHYGILPDILVLAKSMGAGMPLGAFIASKEIMHTLTCNPELGHITTFGGHPVSCAAGLAGLQVILREELHHKATYKGQKFAESLKGHPHIRSVRSCGLMIGLDLDNPQKAGKLMSIFIQNGIISDRFLFRPNSFRIAPPLNITEPEIENALDRITASLNQL